MLDEIDRFVKWTRRRNPEARTWRDYASDLRQFAAVVGDVPPGQVSVRDVDRFVAAQADHGYKPATINRRLAAITALYTFLCGEDVALVCPVRPRRHNVREPKRLPRPVPHDDLERFFAVVDDARDQAMLILMLRCGLRIAEVAALRLGDVYLGGPRPRLIVRGKGSKERAAYLSSQAEHALRLYLAERPAAASDFVFLSYLGDGLSTTAIRKRIMHYRDAAGVMLSAHRLRHSFARDMVGAGMPVTSLQKLLGHAWVETTQGYVDADDHLVRDDFYRASDKVEVWE